jgi:xanthine dehydrogenase YagR molybdenum-binding subunit
MTESATGKALDRVDARLKVMGKAPYAAEIPVARMAHAVMVESTVAKGTITSIDTGDAEKVPGVLLVMTHLNSLKLPEASKKTGPVDRLLQILQDPAILYSGQPVAVVVAETLERAQYGASLVVVRYAESAPKAEMDDILGSAYKPASAGPGGEADSTRGDAAAALAHAHTTMDVQYTTPVQNHNPMEPHATVAVWQDEGRLTLYDATQGIFGVRRKIATLFQLPLEKVRVISHYVGGGFGCKGSPWSHVALAAMAAKVVGRPVKLVVTREQMFSMVGHRPRTLQRVALGADASGTLVAMIHHVTSETSSFDEFVEPSAVQTRMLYACPNVETSHRLVRLDIGTPTFQRAPGESTGTFALESAMDELAQALHMDPLVLRQRNYAETAPDDGKPWSSKSLRECYAQGAERFGWSKRHPHPRSMRDGRWLVGWGMATATYPAKQSPSSAVARARADGTVLVQAGSQDIGTGTYTIMTQIAADALGVAYDRVRFELGDTTFPETPVSGGSQTASSTGSAVKMACLELRKKLVEGAVADRASPLYGQSPDALVGEDGALVALADASKKDSYQAIVARSGQEEWTAEYHTKEKEDRKSFAAHSFGADFVEVRVDDELGEVRVSRVVGAFAAGKILNPKTARSQLIGGIVWGLGFALLEHTERDPRTARVVTRDLADYHVPVHADVPDIEVIMVPEDDPHVNEIGAKGIGEIGITGISAALANAVFHATGKRIRDLPITLDKLL